MSAGSKILTVSKVDLEREIAKRKKVEKTLEANLSAIDRLQKLGALFVHRGNLNSILTETLDAALATSKADFGDIQLLDPQSKELFIEVQHGFPDWWLDYWNKVLGGRGTCSAALRQRKHIIVENVEQSPIFVGTSGLAIHLKAGVRAVQSTPMVSTSGKLVGMFSTHYKTPHRPDDHTLELLDMLAKYAADILERVQMEEGALKVNEEKYAQLLQYAPTAIFEIDYNGPRFKSVNDAMCRLTGYSREELLLMNPVALLVPESRERFQDRIRSGLAGEKIDESVEYKSITKSGKELWVILNVKPTYKDGTLEGALVIGHDITERKRMEKEFISLAKFPSENPHAVLRIDKEGLILYANPESQKLPAPINMTPGQRVSESWRQHVKRALSAKENLDLLETINNRSFLFTVTPILTEGYVNVYGTEITDRLKAEESARLKNMIQVSTNRIFQEALSSRSEFELGQACLDVVRELTGSKFGFIDEFDGEELRSIAISNPGWDKCKELDVLGHHQFIVHGPIHGIYGRVIIDGKGLFTNDPASHPDSIELPPDHPPLNSFLCVPLKNQGRTIGIIAGANREGGYSQAELEALEALAPAVVEAFLRKRTESALLESEQRLSKTQEIAHLGSWELDLATNHLYWSDEVYRIFGLEPQEFGATYEAFLDAIHPDDRAAVDAAYSASLRKGRETYEIDHRVVKKSTGELRVVQQKCDHIRDSFGRVVRSVGMVLDITERVRAEEQLREAERFAAIGRTAAMVGHDLRNPLQAIVGNIDLAQEQLDRINCPPKEKRELKESLREVKSTTFYMDKIVSDLQDYARPVKPSLVRTDLGMLIKETLSTCSIPQSVSVAIGIPNNFPIVNLDSSIIRRVLTNLITNSVQAMPDGGELTINAFRKENPQAIVITVEDTGVGIRPADRGRIFTPLFTTKSKGQGFGLPVCKRLIEGHGGTISFTSQVGKGTKFTIRLPILKEGNSRLQNND
jgi:PAS domain S-box-containing protein